MVEIDAGRAPEGILEVNEENVHGPSCIWIVLEHYVISPHIPMGQDVDLTRVGCEALPADVHVVGSQSE